MSDVINGVRESVDDSGEVTNLVASNQTDRDAEKIVKSELSTPRHKYRYDWYQTETDVCINILIKKLKKENVHVVFQENSVKVDIEVDENDSFNLNVSLAHSINVDKCVTKVLGSKVELRLRKQEGLHWSSLESNDAAVKLQLPNNKFPSVGKNEKNEEIHKYPSSSHYTRDWDKLVAEVKQEEKDEKPEGDVALNKLFQQIYQDGSDDVKKAMNKSFMESGGTVLSTNWGEIGKGRVERKPPDGMEWKEYEK